MALTKVSRNLLSTGIDDQSTSTAITIDSSGRLIVGNTGAFTADSVTIDQGGFAAIRNTSGSCLELRRDTSHGNILDLQIDGQTIGNLGSAGGYLTVLGSTNQVGLKFYSAAANTGIIHPVSGTADLDAAVDLGYSGGRFKDLYLSGGVVFGSTGGSVTSKTLDDYEEGTWTPVITNSGTAPTGVTYGVQQGTYTKIGNKVYFEVAVRLSAYTAGTGEVIITGLPFSMAYIDAYRHPGFSINVFDKAAGIASYVFLALGAAIPNIFFRRLDTDADTSLAAADITSGTAFIGSGVYTTTA